MLQRSLAYITILLFLFQLVEINCQKIPFKPNPRAYHSATLVDNKLYILGGNPAKNIDPGKDFFYLDVSTPFNTLELPWHDLSNINNILPSHNNAATVNGGANNNTLILYGGYSNYNVIMDLVYTFDPEKNSWSSLRITGDNAMSKFALSGVIDQNKKMYLWGGVEVVSGDFTNYMLILDTINFTMGRGNLVGAPTPRQNFGATLLSNQNIIYMGGFDGTKELTLSEVYIYDTINDKWSEVTTTGKLPSNRDGFSAILGLDGQRIIIFGGDASLKNINLPPEDSLYVLNLINFEWFIPKVSGPIPSSRINHRANVIGKYMVVSFGINYNRATESDILLLDISNNNEYIWSTNFMSPLSSSSSIPSSSPIPSTTLTTSVTQAANIDNKKMVGAIVGSLFGGSLLASVGFFLCIWNKNRRNKNQNQKDFDQRNIYNDITNHEPIINSDSNNIYNDRTNNEPIINPAPITNNGRSSQNIDVLKNEFKQEIQNLRQEMLQIASRKN